MPSLAHPVLSRRPPPIARTSRRDRTEEEATTPPTTTPPTTTQPTRIPPTRQRHPRHRHRQQLRRLLRRLPVAVLVAGVLLAVFAAPAFAQASSGTPTLSGVIDNLRNWIVGILAGVATLFLTIGGLRYLTAGGDPGQVEKAKVALKSAAVGYALAILAPLLVSILASIVG
ncbi:MAG: pilin [Acidimicrobiales bacterium]